MEAPLCAKYLSVCSRFEPSGSLVVCDVRVVVDRSPLGESASPFIDKWDDLTRGRERVRMLLSLVAHVGGYQIMVGAHNTV